MDALEPVEVYPSRLAAGGQLVGSVLLSAICVGVMVNVADPGVVPVLTLLIAVALAASSLRSLFASAPSIRLDPSGVHTPQGLIPWRSISSYQVTRSGIPLHLVVHFRLHPDDRPFSLDLQEHSLPPDALLRHFLLHLSHHRPDLPPPP